MSERTQYAAEYPDHCKRCDGWGFVPHRTDGGTEGATCPACLGQGLCPRCHSPFLHTDELLYVICESCGWDEAEDQGMPC